MSNDSIKENADWLLEVGVRSHRGDVTTSMDCAEEPDCTTKPHRTLVREDVLSGSVPIGEYHIR